MLRAKEINMKDTIVMLEEKAEKLKSSMFEMCVKAGTGHIVSSLSCAEILTAIYYGGILRYNPENGAWPERDRLIVSKAHIGVLLYPILADLGYFDKSELDEFITAKGKFGVHLQYSVPGVEMTAGSLGMGFGVAAGTALSAKMNRELFMTIALLGDAELYEGAIWETAMFASHNNLSNLVAVVDRNYLSATDFTENMLALEPLAEKWEAFGWNVKRIDGHNFEQILKAFDGFRSRRSKKPLCIIAETVKGHGIDLMSNKPLWHASVPRGNEISTAREQLKNGGRR